MSVAVPQEHLMFNSQSTYREDADQTVFLPVRHLQRHQCWDRQNPEGKIGDDMERGAEEPEGQDLETVSFTNSRIPVHGYRLTSTRSGYPADQTVCGDQAHQCPGDDSRCFVLEEAQELDQDRDLCCRQGCAVEEGADEKALRLVSADVQVSREHGSTDLVHGGILIWQDILDVSAQVVV